MMTDFLKIFIVAYRILLVLTVLLGLLIYINW